MAAHGSRLSGCTFMAPQPQPSLCLRLGARATGIAILLAALAGCRRGAPEPRAATGGGRPAGDAAVATITEDEVPARPEPSTVENLEQARLADRALCRHARCCVTGIWEAGRDRKGRALVVAE